MIRIVAALCLLAITDAGVTVMPWNEPAPGWPEDSPWGKNWPIRESFQLPKPWSKSDYVAPNCFTARVDEDTGTVLPNNYPFDAQVECPLCKNYTDSTPGFAADPNDCQGFYMCDKRGDTWYAYHMWCADCTFWNQEIVSCVTVEIGTCQATVAPITWPIPSMVPPSEYNKMITTIDFDTGYDGVQGQNGIWVKNKNVQVVSQDCVLGQCGYFDGSARLEVPYFSNNWAHFGEFSVSLFFRKEGETDEEGMLSNDCFDDEPGRKGNSLFASTDGDTANTGLKKPDAEVIGASIKKSEWNHLVLTWDGNIMQVYLNGVAMEMPHGISFPGPIRGSPDHCPLVIGSFILSEKSSYFHGYLDEIAFFNRGLTEAEVLSILSNPAAAYDM